MSVGIVVVLDGMEVDGVMERSEIVDVLVKLESEKESNVSESEIFGGVGSWRGTLVA